MILKQHVSSPYFSTDDLLRLYSHILYEFNIETKSINFLFSAGKMVFENGTVEQMLNFVSETEDLIPEESDKILTFLQEQLTIFSDNFFLPLKCLTNAGKKVSLFLRGFKKGNTVLCGINSSSQELKISSTKDPLTKTYNRDTMLSYVEKEFQIKDNRFILVEVNIDNFISLNKEHGYLFGDVILFEVAAAIANSLGLKGQVGRIHDDVFLVLYHIKDTDEYRQIWQICRKILFAIEGVTQSNSKNVPVSATLACTCFPKDGNTYEEHAMKLTQAMIRGKSLGGSRFIIYSDERCKDIEVVNPYTKSKDHSDYLEPEMQVISSIFDIMNRHLPLGTNIVDAISLVGNFFSLDRINFSILENNATSVYDSYQWLSPTSKDMEGRLISSIKTVEIFQRNINQDGYLQIYNVENNPDDELHSLLFKQGTKALLAFDLRTTNNDLVGTIRFETCKLHRIWLSSELHYLGLLSKIFASSIYKFLVERKLEDQMYRDELTGIYNQSKFISLAGVHLLEGTPSCIVYFNISRFQLINDKHGYECGNKLLIFLAGLFKKHLPENSIFSRVSADKFLALIPSDNIPYIEKIFSVISEEVKNIKCENFVGNVVLLAGAYIPLRQDSIYKAIDYANIAMQSLPQLQAPKMIFYGEEFHRQMTIQTEMKEHMYTALKNEEYIIYYQPKFNISTNEIIGAEALTRWNYKGERLIQPYEFIPLFEKTGFICELDFYVFEQVCKFLKHLQDLHNKTYPISVNMSRYQFNFNQYIDKIEVIRKRYDISPDLIEIEITEGLIVSNTSLIAEFIKKLRSIGYKVSMDDFGSGYSNLSSLSTLDFNTIKLDKGFCSNSYNTREHIIIANVVHMAYELDIDVICEGVETKSQADTLERLGCKQAQGWLFDKAIPEKEFIEKYIKVN